MHTIRLDDLLRIVSPYTLVSLVSERKGVLVQMEAGALLQNKQYMLDYGYVTVKNISMFLLVNTGPYLSITIC